MEPEKVNLNGKNILMTGATDGIGKLAAQKFAMLGAKLYLVGRSRDKTEIVRKEIIESTGNSKVEILFADLSRQNDVKAVAKEFIESGTSLDILINNAAVFGYQSRVLSEDGYEMHFAVNYLATYTLTNLLLKSLLNSKPSRIVNIVSDTYTNSSFSIENYNAEVVYNYRQQYAFSKLCLILFSMRLAELLKGTKTTVNFMHPGLVETGISERASTFYKLMLKAVGIFYRRSLEDAANDYIHMAIGRELEGINGQYFIYSEPGQLNDTALNSTYSTQLMELSHRLTGINIVDYGING